MFVCYYHVTYEFQSESTDYSLPECQKTSCSKQKPYLKFKWQQRDSNPQPLSPWTNTHSFSQTGCGFESRCVYMYLWIYKWNICVCLSVCLSVSECIFICLGTYLTFTIQLKDYTKNQAEVVVAKVWPNFLQLLAYPHRANFFIFGRDIQNKRLKS